MAVGSASRLRLLALAVGGALALAACSSGGGTTASGAAASPTSPVTASATTATSGSGSDCASLAGLQGTVTDHGTQAISGSSVSLDAGDFFFEATCLTASGGQTVSVTVTNGGSALHNFSVTSLGIDEDVAAGASITVDVKLPATGTLPFQCKYHLSSGMVGAFVIS